MKKLIIAIALSLIVTAPLVFNVAATQPVFGPDQTARGQQLDTIVAIVDDDIITRSELNSDLAAIESQISQSDTPLPPREVLENQVLERLILTHLQLRAAERNGVVIDDQTVNAALDNIARQNNITLSQLRQTIEGDGFSFARFRDDIREELLATRLRQRVVDSRIQVSEQEVDNWLARTRSNNTAAEYHIAQILISLPEGASPEQIEASREKALQILEQLRQGADFARLAMSVSDGRQALEGGDLGWRTASQIPTLFVDLVPRLQPGEVSDLIRSPSGFHIVKLLDVKGAPQQLVTQTQARHILIETNELISDEDAQVRLQRLRERILNGEDFSQLARANSNDVTSAVDGGDLGWVTPGSLVPDFEAEMNKLEPGEISEPFKTPFGWHIVQVLDRRNHDNATESQRAAAREALFRRKVEEEWDLWLRRLRDEAYVEIRLNNG